jgi:ClpP class serine protease
MINFDEENDLMPEIAQELSLAHQTTEELATDVHSFKDIQEQLDLLAQENTELNKRLETTIGVEQFNEVIKKRDEALRMLLGEIKKLHEKIREIRGEINAKTDE